MYEEISTETALRLYEIMVRIRRFEETIHELYAKGRIPGFLHTYVGEEAIAAGVCANLGHDDKITSTHRGHGHLIAKGGHLSLMMAELFGKATGYNKGKGGSMHIAEPDIGSLGANAIVGAGIAIINGAALAAQYLGTEQVGVAFFGDGASNTGAFHEALNLASVYRLPTIFVCENNKYAESTPQWQHQRIKDIAIRAKSYDIPAVIVDGNNVGDIFLASKKAIENARRGGGPTFIEAKTNRWHGHHAHDTQHYRSKDELAKLESTCPIRSWRKVLLERGVYTESLENAEGRIDREIDEAVRFAEESPQPDISEAYTDVFTPYYEE